MESRIIRYNGLDGKPEIAIKCTLDECLSWGGLGICDLCNSFSPIVYLCPELGHKGLCSKCFEEHKNRVEWYEEDKEYIIEDLNDFTTYYKIRLNETDVKEINSFLENIDTTVRVELEGDNAIWK